MKDNIKGIITILIGTILGVGGYFLDPMFLFFNLISIIGIVEIIFSTDNKKGITSVMNCEDKNA